jgi:hypothetical protein
VNEVAMLVSAIRRLELSATVFVRHTDEDASGVGVDRHQVFSQDTPTPTGEGS